MADEEDIVLDPVLVVEVLSASSASYDRNAKRALYRLIPSLDHYLVVSRNRLRVEVDTRIDDGWATAHVIGLGATVSLSRLGLDLPMTTIYQDTDLARDGA